MAQELPVVGKGEPGVVRTALCVEPRDGMIHVFFPPLHAAEDWLDLARRDRGRRPARLGRKVVLEGYLPPRDPSGCCISPSRPIPA